MARLTSHTLDGSNGTHAGGIEVTLVNLNSGETLLTTRMDSAGRLDEAIELGSGAASDRYELAFNTGAYWQSLGVTHAQRVDEIVLRFTMPDCNARYHMPVIISPNSYSMWSSLPE